MIRSAGVHAAVFAGVIALECFSSGCHQLPRSRPRPPPAPAPQLPAFASGEARKIAISPYVGNRMIGERLAQELAEWRDRRVTAIQIVNAQFPGDVLAWVAVNWAAADGPHALVVDDAMILMAGCLRGVYNWAVPRIAVSVDAEAREVIAQAAFTSGNRESKHPRTFSRPLRTPSGIPWLFVHVTAVPPDHEWIGQKGLALYGQRTNGGAAPALPRSP